MAFGKTAEFIEKYVSKGMKMAVEGRWQTGSYKNKDGNTIYTNDCVVEHIEFCEAKRSGQQNYQQDYTTQGSFDPDGFEEVPEEDLPF